MKKFLIMISSVVMLLTGCEATTEHYFDTPFVSIADKDKLFTTTFIDKNANNLLSELCVTLVVGRDMFQEPIMVEYELIVGNGLKEGVDFKLQPSTASPLTFTPGTYDMPVRLIWMKNKDFDPSKDNTLEVRLTACSIPEIHLGYLGPDSIRKSFIFTKK